MAMAEKSCLNKNGGKQSCGTLNVRSNHPILRVEYALLKLSRVYWLYMVLPINHHSSLWIPIFHSRIFNKNKGQSVSCEYFPGNLFEVHWRRCFDSKIMITLVSIDLNHPLLNYPLGKWTNVTWKGDHDSKEKLIIWTNQHFSGDMLVFLGGSGSDLCLDVFGSSSTIEERKSMKI